MILRSAFSTRQWCIIVLACIVLCGCRTVESERQFRHAPTSSTAQGGPPALRSLPADKQATAGTSSEPEGTAQPRRLPPPDESAVLPASTSLPANGIPDENIPAGPSAQSAAPTAVSVSDDDSLVRDELHAAAVGPPANVPAGVAFLGAAPPGYAQLPPAAWGGDPGPWYPEDEYLIDGGDRLRAVVVQPDGTVRGIDPQDTVAQFETVGGARHIVPSNPVPIYAPRFAAIRQVSGVLVAGATESTTDMEQPLRVVSQERREGPAHVLQPTATERNLNVQLVYGFRQRQLPLGLEQGRSLHGLTGELLSYENLSVVRTGSYDNSEKARLASAITAAKTWSHDAALQVVIDGRTAFEASGGNAADETARYEMPPGKPRLRLIKIASRQDAQPGEVVHFTLRFDNVGDQVLQNVTILDRLTTRLEYVADSAESSMEAQFSATQVEEGSTVLRWDIKGPIRVGEGGILKFQCLVK